VAPAPAGATPVKMTYANDTALTIPAFGAASLYPSTIAVSNLCGTVTEMTVTLKGLSHTYPDDLTILLVGPAGQKLLLMAHAGGGADAVNLTIQFEDTAASHVPSGASLTSGVVKPAYYAPAVADLPAPAPTGPYTSDTFDDAFADAAPNGTWQLFVADDAPTESGSLVGWELGLTTNCAILTTAASPGGSINLNPAGTPTLPAGNVGYSFGTVVTLTPQPDAGQTFVGWTFLGGPLGWANPLTATLNGGRALRANFAPTKTFADVPPARDDYAAIVALATRGLILGYNATTYGPDDGVQRAQMAALIARAMPTGPDIPGLLLAPPACTIADTWDCELWPNTFTDQGGLDANLWRDVAALQHYGVAQGYAPADCAARGKVAPCFGPTDPVTYAETIVFITRAMIAKGYWVAQPAAPQPYAGVPAVLAQTVATYHFYTAGAGGVQAPPGDWNAGATRGWFARALWQALDTYWGVDGILPGGGGTTGGYMP
jgi:subtilisin-like proprotein convertase family protein